MSNTSIGGDHAANGAKSDNDMKVVHTFAKNAFEEVRAYVQPFKGYQLAHIRVFRPDEHDIDRPTGKGIAVNVRDLPKLARAVEALLAATKASSN